MGKGWKRKGATRIAASLVAFILTGVEGAWSADCIVDGAPSRFTAAPAVAPAGRDATLELKWDNGILQYYLAFYSGAGAWVGNDFDVSTISTSVPILKYKFYTTDVWPNEGWDGVGVAFYNFVGGVPGSLVWPTSGKSHFFKPGSGGPDVAWAECDVNWKCPFTKFLAAHDQIYSYPRGDPCGLDNNPTCMGHSWYNWLFTEGWELYRLPGTYPYWNFMIRVLVDDTTAVAPTSLGRVKALYY